MKKTPFKLKHNPNSSVFVRQFSDANVALNFRGNPSDEFYSYGAAYHRAGMAAFKAHFSKGTFHDLDALPVAFLLRHAAELYLKAIVRNGNALLELHDRPLVQVHQTHRLTLLLEDVRPIFKFKKWSWDADKEGFHTFADFRKFIADLEKDEILGTDDSQADMWRYPVRKKDKKGKKTKKQGDEPHLPVHFHFDVREFVKRLDVLLRTLGGAAIGLDMAREDFLDALAYEAQGQSHDEHYDHEPPDYEPPDWD